MLACSECERNCSWVVSGQADVLTSQGVLYDFKVTSAWSFLLEDGEVKSEWEGQLNVLAHLARNRHWYYGTCRRIEGHAGACSAEHEAHRGVDCGPGKRIEHEGLTVNAARVLAFIRDFSPTQAQRNMEDARRAGGECLYPVAPMHCVEVPLWTDRSAQAFFRQRLQLHARYDGAPVQKVPECSPGQRWHKGDQWAVYKLKQDGTKPGRAARVFRADRKQTEAEAWAFADTLKNEGKDAVVETRLGESTKCIYACSYRSVCPYGKSKAVTNRYEDHAREREASGMAVKRWT